MQHCCLFAQQCVLDMDLEVLFCTERLSLRFIQHTDRDLYMQLHRDPLSMQYVRDVLPTAELELRFQACLEEYADEDGDWLTLVVETQGTAAGLAVIKRESVAADVIEIGYVVLPQYRGHGLGFAIAQALMCLGFEHMLVRKVMAVCVDKNHASIQILKKLGMLSEGCLRQQEKINNCYHDLQIFGLLRSEWQCCH